MSGRNAEIVLNGRCTLACSPCDCAYRRSEPDLTSRFAGGGSRLILRGGTDHSPELVGAIKQARDAGFIAVHVRSSAMRAREPEWVAQLVSAGAHGVVVPFFSHISRNHDAIAGLQGALVNQLVGIRACADAGLEVEAEIPILSTKVQQLDAIVSLLHRAVPTLARVSFRRLPWQLPMEIAPEAWSITGPALARGIDACRAANVPIEISERYSIPLCALRERPDLFSVFRFDPKRKVQLLEGMTRPAASCSDCKVKRLCGGISRAEMLRLGTAGLKAFSQQPREFQWQGRPLSVWTPERRSAASKAEFLVLRPTVNCNQDCVFCSANETSKNVWAAPDAMYRQIARAAKRGVSHISFSGGEPTLSPELVGYCKAARRLGIERIELITNGVLLNENRVRALVDAGLTRAFISLHAHEEALSRLATAKIGDFERTVRAIELFAESGIETKVNHVISALNYRHLTEFVEFCHSRFGKRVELSFAFVTPQFRALENIELMPRLSEVVPYLDRAMARALELGLSFTVGARQGIPPCFLGRFRAWSDVFRTANAAHSEDGIQKRHGPACKECRYRDHCLGLRHPYIDRYGFDEIVPIRGPAFTPEEVSMKDFPVQSFDALPEALRDRDAEVRAERLPPLPRAPMRLPVVAMPQRSRPLRVALFGSGRRARTIARAFEEVPQLSLEAVCSRQMPLEPSPDFGGCPAFRDPIAVLEGQRPEAVIIATTTESHLDLARLAIERGIPCLIEKPLAPSLAEAEQLAELAESRRVLVMPAHNVLFGAGFLEFVDETTRYANYLRRCPRSAPDAPQAWSADAIFQSVYHSLVLVGRAMGGGRAKVVAASFVGGGRPERLRFSLEFAQGLAELELDFDARVDELSLRTRRAGAGERIWRRSGADVVVGPVEAPLPVQRRQGELSALLEAFRAAVVMSAAPTVTVREGVDVLHNAREIISALRSANAPLSRPNAPKHVASRELKPRL